MLQIISDKPDWSWTKFR